MQARAIVACLIVLFLLRDCNTNQSAQVLIQAISHFCCWLPGCVASSLELRCYREKNGTGQPFTCACIHIKLLVPWETGNQRIHYLLPGQLHSSGRAEVQASRSRSRSFTLTGPLCRSHREVIELHSRHCGSQPPLQTRTLVCRGCVRLVGRLWLRRGQTNVAWQGNWEALLWCECVGCIGIGGPGIWPCFKSLQGFPEQSSLCDGVGPRQQAQKLVGQSKHRSVAHVSDRELIVHWLSLLPGKWVP